MPDSLKTAESVYKRAHVAETSVSNAVTPKDIQIARNKWIRATNVLTQLLTLDESISEEIVIHLLPPLRTAEAKFAKKKSRLEVEDDEELVDETDAVDFTPTRVAVDA